MRAAAHVAPRLQSPQGMMDPIKAAFRDMVFAVRSLRRTPGFTFIAILTLGLGIGANTSMFSVLAGYQLRPSPYPSSERLERIYRATPQISRGSVSSADYLELKTDTSGYGQVATYGNASMNLSEPGQAAEMVPGLRISANLFSVLGMEPGLGRSFRPEEETPGNHRVLIISHRYWQNRFGGDADIIGRQVRVDGEPFQIVGVMPENFSDWRHLSFINLYRPLALDDEEKNDRSTIWLRLVGRRSDAIPPARAGEFIASVGKRLAEDFPVENAESNWHTVPIGKSWVEASAAGVMTMLVGLSGFVLLIACSNLANLLLARTMARAREFAVRGALGASRARLLLPLLIESLLVALAGGALAVFVASWTFDWIAVASGGDSGNVGVVLTLDWRVLGWLFGVSLFTAVAFGVVPAMFAQRLDLNSTLKSGSRGSTADRGHQRFRQFLIVGQFVLAMVLLAGAGLFIHGLHELNNRRHGWESDNLVTGTVLLPAATYGTDEKIRDFQRLTLERFEALPGVTSASLSYSMPFFGLAETRKYVVAGREAPQAGHEPAAVINGVTPQYFETVGTPLLSGRAFNAGDTLTSPRVFIINAAMARGLFGDQSPIGQRISQAGVESGESGEIVGVVGDVQSVWAEPDPVLYQLYQPMAQEPRRLNEIAVRTTGVPPAALVESIRATMMSLDPDLPVRRLQPAEETIAVANYQLGVLRSLLSALGLLGLGLASLGIYGVMARTTIQRRGEFGIRIALGAQAGDITRLVLRSGATLALLGAGIGLMGALAVAELLAMAFPRMEIQNVPILLGVTLLLVAIGLLACYIPARSASKVNPNDTLRAE
ncbi:MAG TPA: ABC transporter permease [Thermoanaerobaculia bacterium]|nr:ABC transporter permease [Thermoanaerobaculia bacterium]